MSKRTRNIIIVICTILVTACISWAYVEGKASRSPLICNGIDITIADSTINSFISRHDVKQLLDKEYGQYNGSALEDIDLFRIEEILEDRSAINNAEAYVTKDGILNITVTQRRPVVRFQGAKWGYYADVEGRAFPLQSSYASYVPVVDGNIPSMTDSIRIIKITSLVNNLENDDLWKEKFVQIHIDDKDNIILIPREGKEKFMIGQPNNIEEKMIKMEKYYTHIVPAKGSGQYRIVDLRYDGQIVCR